MATVTEQHPSKDDSNLESITELGQGKAAVVNLVMDSSTGRKYAEKVFKSGRSFSRIFRDVIYFCCFQAPFPYGTNESATRAAFYRRKVLRDLTEFWFGIPLVADAIYTRWDVASKCYVLGTKYVDGYGPKPGQFDPHLFRNIILKYLYLLLKVITRRNIKQIRLHEWEIEKVASKLDDLRDKFHQAGFIGSEWQVDKRLSISTSNLLKDKNGRWMLIDMESGMPALVLPRYIWLALKTGKFPLFDDTDFAKLYRYLEMNRADLIVDLGEDRFQHLLENAQQLEYYSEKWKSSELAVFRHRTRVVTDPQLMSRIRANTVENWYRKGKISAKMGNILQNSYLLFILYLAFCLLKDMSLGFVSVIQSTLKFILNAVLGLYTAVRLILSAFIKEEYLRYMAMSFVNNEVDSWEKSGRLTQREANELRRDMQSPDVVEYLKGFTIHVTLKLIDLPFVGNLFIVWLAIYYEIPQLLGSVFISSALRTLYTLYRAIRNWGKGISYRNALLVGMLPQVGVLAYPMQMTSVQPRLSRFLALQQASKFGSKIPLFGGTDSRIEHLCMRLADIVASVQYEIAYLPNRLVSLLINRNFTSAARKASRIATGTGGS